MKEIQPIQMWQNGVFVEAIYLNTYASTVILGTNAGNHITTANNSSNINNK